MMAGYDNPGSQRGPRSILAALAIVLSLAAAAAGILGYFKLPTSWPWEKPRPNPYEADLSKPNEATSFRDFLLHHEHDVVRLALFVPIQQELPNGRTAPIYVRWAKGDIKAFRIKVGCRNDTEEKRLICNEMQVEFVRSEEARPDFGRVSAGYFSVKGLYAVEPVGGELDPYVVGLRPVRPEDSGAR
jgi:hypothetical protein